MILTCEECHARYLVPTHSVPAEGRKVRCGNCGHTWFQAAAVDEEGGAAAESFASMVEDAARDGDSGVDSIPEGVRPIPDGSSVPAHIGASSATWGDRLAGYAVAAAIFILINSGIYIFRDAVMQAWPESAAIYNLAGIAPAEPLAGLIFDRIEAKTEYNAEGIEVLSVSGQIINLRDRESDLAPIRVSMRVSGDETLHDWVIDPPASRIGPEESMEFTTTYPDIPADAKEVNVQFTLAGR